MKIVSSRGYRECRCNTGSYCTLHRQYREQGCRIRVRPEPAVERVPCGGGYRIMRRAVLPA